jgi:DNA recombination protein RmuC
VEVARGIGMGLQAQDGGSAAPAPASAQEGALAAPPPGAFTSAAGPALAAVAAALLLFMIVTYFVARWRIGARARAPAARRAGGSAEPDFFQPAGDGAEITFDDGPAGAAPIDITETSPEPEPRRPSLFGRDRRAPGRAARKAPAQADRDEFDAGEGAAVIIEHAAAPEPSPAPRRGVFSGLFGRRKPPEDRPSTDEPEFADPDAEDETTVEIIRDEPASAAADPAPAVHVRDAPAPRPASDWRERLDAERRALEEREIEARRAAAEEELRRDMARRTAEREAEFERRKLAASLEQRQLDVDARERALASRERALVAETERIRAETAREAEARAAARAEREAPLPGPRDARREAGGVDAIGHYLDEHRQATSAAIKSLAARLDAIAGRDEDLRGIREDVLSLKRALGGRNARPAAPIVHLSDIMRNALPPDAYEIRASLGDNRRADCLVRLPRPAGPIAIDARFPVEAFAALHAAPESDARAENEFRRVALKHVVDVAERNIVPGATGDSAIMFLPSETMCAELHARFPDIVEDGYRARVWTLSPTSLMATLNAMRAVMREAPQRAGEPGLAQSRLISEIEELRRRVGALEGGATRPGAAAEPSPGASAREDPAPERAGAPDSRPPPGAVASAPEPDAGPDLWEDRRGSEPPRQPFPLR